VIAGFVFTAGSFEVLLIRRVCDAERIVGRGAAIIAADEGGDKVS
jgi:hypothetical protein